MAPEEPQPGGGRRANASEITGIRGQYTGKHGELHGRWLEFSAKTVSGDIAVLHSTATGAAAGGGR